MPPPAPATTRLTSTAAYDGSRAEPAVPSTNTTRPTSSTVRRGVSQAIVTGLSGGPRRVPEWFMPLSGFPVRTSIAVSDIGRAVAFYEGKLGLEPLATGPSASIADGSRVYGSGGGPALNVYQSATAGKTPATLATWYVDDLDRIVDELTSAAVGFVRYEGMEHDARGITARAGGGRIAWFQDPDGNTFALEADT